KGIKNSKNYNWDKLAESIENARKNNPDDQELDEMNLAMYKFKSSSLSEERQHFQEFLAANPRSPIGHAYLASVEFREGHKDQAILLLKKALTLQPDNQRIMETLAKIPQAKPGDKIFTLQLGVKLNDAF
ncbi:MAG: tetratricopeptide repeat protein, partial [Pseudomonadota bacterium]